MNRQATRLLASMVAAAIVIALFGCKDIGDGEGGQCQPCLDQNPRCDSGLVCKQFSGGGETKDLCARPETTKCNFVP
ncbi:hypothetical protein [Aquabacterium humicola]|uniref:hypothetical protein n=1 Tax=Aquabacterium humicola TaxID=3237377 RepID=UPI002543C062|nr:hypothetical protein [Rubrivivax pictus]